MQVRVPQCSHNSDCNMLPHTCSDVLMQAKQSTMSLRLIQACCLQRV